MAIDREQAPYASATVRMHMTSTKSLRSIFAVDSCPSPAQITAWRLCGSHQANYDVHGDSEITK